MTTTMPLSGTSKIGGIYLRGVEEIIGKQAAQCLPVQQRSGQRTPSVAAAELVDVAALQQALEAVYGTRGGRGLALRAGRAGFKFLLRQYGAGVGLSELNFRLLPMQARLKTGLEVLAGLMSQLGDEVVQTEVQETCWLWRVEQCPICWQRDAKEPICHFTVGLLQEFFAWGSGGKVYQVEETACQANGDPACLIRIDKRPLD